MTEALRRMEVSDGLIANHTQVFESGRMGYFKRILNVEFVDTFMETMQDIRKLQEFVYMVDCLTEISKSSSFPSGRLLNSPDVYNSQKTVTKFNQLSHWTGDQSYLGCQVGQATKELIEEFFHYTYTTLLGELFYKSKLPFVVFSLDGAQYTLHLVRDIKAIRSHSIVRLSIHERAEEVIIPFLKARLAWQS